MYFQKEKDECSTLISVILKIKSFLKTLVSKVLGTECQGSCFLKKAYQVVIHRCS